MSEHSFSDKEFFEKEAAQWAPSANLCRWLLIGAWAVALDVCLSAASLSIGLLREKEPQGFSITNGLDWAVLLPQILVLLAFLALAREAVSIGLWRSSIGVFASMWLMAVYSIGSSETEGVGLWEVLTTVAVVIGIVCLFVVVCRRPSAFLQPAARESPSQKPAMEKPESNEPGANQSEKSAWGCGNMLMVAFTAAVILKWGFRLIAFLLKRVFPQVAFDGFLVCIVVLCCVVCSLLAFLAWFGISKIRLRHKLGCMAAVSGWADLALVALSVAFCLFIAFVMVQAAVNQEQELDSFDAMLRIPTTVMEVFDLVWKALLAALFLSVRGRFDRSSGRAKGEGVFSATR